MRDPVPDLNAAIRVAMRVLAPAVLAPELNAGTGFGVSTLDHRYLINHLHTSFLSGEANGTGAGRRCGRPSVPAREPRVPTSVLSVQKRVKKIVVFSSTYHV